MRKMQTNPLNALLERDKKAQTYFGSLPDFVQGGIMLRSEEVHTEEDLRRCAESIFHEFE